MTLFLHSLPHELANQIYSQLGRISLQRILRVSKATNSHGITYLRNDAASLKDIALFLEKMDAISLNAYDLLLLNQAIIINGVVDYLLHSKFDVVAAKYRSGDREKLKKIKVLTRSQYPTRTCSLLFSNMKNRIGILNESGNMLWRGFIEGAISMAKCSSLMNDQAFLINSLSDFFDRTEHPLCEKQCIDFAKYADAIKEGFEHSQLYVGLKESTLLPLVKVHLKKKNISRAIELADAILQRTARDCMLEFVCHNVATIAPAQAYPIIDLIKNPKVKNIALQNLSFSRSATKKIVPAFERNF